MPITSWTPQNVLRPVLGGFRPATYQLMNVARALAPGQRTRSSLRLKQTGPFSATIDAFRRGPQIFPIVSGAGPHAIFPRNARALRFTDGQWRARVFVHPGSQPHPFLNQALRSWPALYAANVRRRWH